MDNQQLRIQQLENQNAQWQAWYQAQQMPQQQTPQYQKLPQLQLKPQGQQQPPAAKKQKKAAKAPTNKTSFETKFFILCFILSIFAVGYLVEQWNKAEKPRSTKITAR